VAASQVEECVTLVSSALAAVHNEELRVTLKDERLQRLLAEVDSSSNREKVGGRS